ncbi:YDG/SRA domain-containing protein [Streptomyces scopuliridis]|uniref:YDG/SRA domain-containing protein n=1 Tax=Streptomyces scopuliridis TaxID=452529 RepID=UPI0009965C68|nr:YDG/SRA domain-containing protein [Streptomyces scopuliridis]
MAAYRAVFGHVDNILPGAHFATRQDVKEAKLHKEREAGISWGLDDEGERAADAIVLNNGYEDDRDLWSEVLYTGAGGRNRNTGRQIENQSWENRGNSGLRRSQIKGYPVRVIRGSDGEQSLSPVNGYRYDGLYGVVDCWIEKGNAGFQICRYKLLRLTDDEQELTSLEQQVQEALRGAPRRRTTTVERIVRDTEVVRRVKRWHGYTCQICALALTVGADGASYVEGAHIQPLGGPDGGPDIDGNVLSLCPNCHVRLDRGALYLTDDLQVIDRYAEGSAPRSVPLRTVEKHRIEQRFVRAHRRLWRILD